jgi:hypothetical protein
MTEWYIRIQIDFAHFCAQLTAALALTGIFEFNIGTVLILNSKSKLWIEEAQRSEAVGAARKANSASAIHHLLFTIHYSFCCPSAIGSRQSKIGNSSHPGPSHDRRNSSRPTKKFRTGAIMYSGLVVGRAAVSVTWGRAAETTRSYLTTLQIPSGDRSVRPCSTSTGSPQRSGCAETH